MRDEDGEKNQKKRKEENRNPTRVKPTILVLSILHHGPRSLYPLDLFLSLLFSFPHCPTFVQPQLALHSPLPTLHGGEVHTMGVGGGIEGWLVTLPPLYVPFLCSSAAQPFVFTTHICISFRMYL